MINTTKANATEIIKEQLKLIYNGDPWYGDSITSVLNSVDPKLIFDSPGNGLHSIAELTAHMLTYRILQRIDCRGIPNSLPIRKKRLTGEHFPLTKKAFGTL